MRETILAAFAIAVLLAFLGILLWEVPRLDLGVIIAVTVIFAVWDLLTSHGDRTR
jgi:hypothetical protein